MMHMFQSLCYNCHVQYISTCIRSIVTQGDSSIYVFTNYPYIDVKWYWHIDFLCFKTPKDMHRWGHFLLSWFWVENKHGNAGIFLLKSTLQSCPPWLMKRRIVTVQANIIELNPSRFTRNADRSSHYVPKSSVLQLIYLRLRYIVST